MDDFLQLFNDGGDLDDDDVWDSPGEEDDPNPICSSIERACQQKLGAIEGQRGDAGRAESFKELFGSKHETVRMKNSKPSTSSSTGNKGIMKNLGKSKSASNLKENNSLEDEFGSLADLFSEETAPKKPSNSVKKPPSSSLASTLTVDVISEPHSKLRLKKDSITMYKDDGQTFEDALKERNYGLNYVPFAFFHKWHAKKIGLDLKSIWTCGVLTRKNPARTSNKGNDYIIWEISDLKSVEKPLSLFLFGTTSFTSMLSIPVGSLIDLVIPRILADDDKKEIKLSISNANQINVIGICRDFGICSSKRKKDGKACTNPVNLLECPYCIHHAAWEYGKLNSKGFLKGRGKGLKRKADSQPSAAEHDAIISTSFGSYSVSSKVVNGLGIRPGVRMELQGSLNEMKRNPLKFGNHESITFHPANDVPEGLGLPKYKPKPKEPLRLDPEKTPHLSEKDRKILKSLEESSKSKSEIPSIIAKNVTAGSSNFLQHLRFKHDEKQRPDARLVYDKERRDDGKRTISMNRETMKSMQKALNFVRGNGKISKTDPNEVCSNKNKKIKLEDMPKLTKLPLPKSKSGLELASSGKKGIDVNSEEFKKILNAKSIHSDFTDRVRTEEYFSELETKEAIENKLLNTFSIPTKGVVCKTCNYTAVGQSDYCKAKLHKVTYVDTHKRFFKCKQCSQRTMCLERLPTKPCKSCKSTSWEITSVGKERKGPTLPTEELSIRGDEEKFIGSSSGKLFLNISV